MQLYIYKKIHPYNNTVKMSKFVESVFLHKKLVWMKSDGNYIILWRGSHEFTGSGELTIPGIEDAWARREFSATAEFLVRDYEPYVNSRSTETIVEEIQFQELPYYCYCESAYIKVYSEGDRLKVEFVSGENDMKGFIRQSTPVKLTLTQVRRYI